MDDSTRDKIIVNLHQVAAAEHHSKNWSRTCISAISLIEEYRLWRDDDHREKAMDYLRRMATKGSARDMDMADAMIEAASLLLQLENR